MTNYIYHPLIEGKCVLKCHSGQKWYLDDSNNYFCADNCPLSRKFYIPENNQCVESCSKTGTCIYCKSIDKTLYKYENSCVENCPDKYTKNEKDLICEYNSDECYYEKYISDMTVNQLELNVDQIGKNYSNYYTQSNQIVIIKNTSKTYTITISKRDDCITNLINASSCINLLKTNNIINDNENMITLTAEYQKDKKSSKIYTYAFFYNNGTRIDNSICSKEKVIVNIDLTKTNSDVELAEEMSKKGIDIYDINDPFFTDHCYPFTSNENKDVSLKERIEKYYQNVSLCEDGCDYIGLNLTEDSFEAQCECNTKTNFVFDSLNNSLTGEFVEILSSANFKIFTCYKYPFNFKKIWSNLGSWVVISFSLTQLVFFIIYVKDGFLSILVQLQQHANEKKCNPPKKRSNHYLQSKFVISDITDKNNIYNINDDNKNENNNIFKTDNFYNENEENEENEMSENDDDNKNNQIESPATLIIKKSNLSNKNNKKNKVLTLKEDVKKRYLSKKYKKVINSTANNMTELSLNSSENGDELSKRALNIKKTENSNFSKDKITISKYQETKIKEKASIKNTENEFVNNILEDNEYNFIDDDLDNLALEDAKNIDKRSFCYFYWNQVKDKEDVVYMIFNSSNLESYQIRVIIFFCKCSFFY